MTRTPGTERHRSLTSTMRCAAFVCFFLMYVAGSCSLNTNPELPAWDAEFNVPLGTETTSLSEWVEESDELVEDASGVIAFRFEGTMDRTQIGDRLKIDPIEASFHPSIGTFELDAPASQETELLFTDLWPPSQALVGQSVPIPGFQFQDVGATVPEMEGFHSMTLEEGTLKAVLLNQLPVAIDDASLSLVDEHTSTLIATIDFPSIPAGQADSSVADLAGKTLTNYLGVRAGGGSQGSGMNLVVVNAGAGATISISLDNLKAVDAVAELPATEIELDETTEIPEGMVFTEAQIARGGLYLEFDNELPVALGGSFEIEEFRDPSGAAFVIDVNIPADGRSTTEVPLDGYIISAASPAPGEPQLLNIRAGVTTEETDGNVSIEAGDGLTVEVLFDTLSFYQVSGILDSTGFDMSSTTQELDIPEDLDQISLGGARLSLEMVYSISVPLFLSMEAVGRSEKGTVVTLPIEIAIGGSEKTRSDTSRVVLDETNSTIVDFLNNLPTTVTVSGEAYVGDGRTEGTVSQDDFLEGTFMFEVPLYLAFEEQVIEAELTEIEILPENGDVDGGDNAVDGELSSRMKSAEIWVTFVNHTPLGAVVTAGFATDSTRVFSDPDFALGPVELMPGIVDETGAVVEAVESPNSLILTSENLEVFRNTGVETKIVYMGSTIRLLSTNGQAVKICSSDYIQTQARICFTATVGLPDSE